MDYDFDFCSWRNQQVSLMKRSALLILALILYGSSFAAFWAISVKTLVLYPTMDSYSWQSVPEANNGRSNNFEITSYNRPPYNMRGWIAFNVSEIPTNTWILKATFRLRVWHKTLNDTVMGTGDTTGRTYGVYRIIQPWDELTVNWANQPNYTELHHATSPVPSGQGGWFGPLLWMDWDAIEIVKDWQSGAANYGLVVRDTQEYAPIFYSTQFFTHDQVPSPDYYPRLLVTHIEPQSLELLVVIIVGEGLFIIGLRRSRHKSRR
jgi:hypothetical protein